MATRTRTRLATFPLAAALALTLAGCTAEVVQDGPETSQAAETAETPSSSTASETPDDAPGTTTPEETDDAESPAPSAQPSTLEPVTLPAGATWLSDVPSESARASGTAVDVTVRGVTPTNAAGQFLGCDGVADVTQYQLDGQYATLDGRLAMRDGVPEGVVAEVVLYTDDGPVSAYRIDGTDNGVSFRILLDDVDVLELHARATEGECAPDDVPYLAFVDTYVTP